MQKLCCGPGPKTQYKMPKQILEYIEKERKYTFRTSFGKSGEYNR